MSLTFTHIHPQNFAELQIPWLESLQTEWLNKIIILVLRDCAAIFITLHIYRYIYYRYPQIRKSYQSARRKFPPRSTNFPIWQVPAGTIELDQWPKVAAKSTISYIAVRWHCCQPRSTETIICHQLCSLQTFRSGLVNPMLIHFWQYPPKVPAYSNFLVQTSINIEEYLTGLL